MYSFRVVETIFSVKQAKTNTKRQNTTHLTVWASAFVSPNRSPQWLIKIKILGDLEEIDPYRDLS